MKPTVAELEGIVRNRLCAVCNQRSIEGICGSEEPGRCSLFELFPLVAQAILATESEDIQPYVEAIHENVCAVCLDQRLDGSCLQREEARCALNAYLPQVVEAIEEALGRPLRPVSR
jgi:hypothetical protein